ncbi:MAG: MOSC domain-containing protein [Bryobacteraceae bacterium]|nr:MOSC domain-containing protein [Bryobacteraceae bacterium]
MYLAEIWRYPVKSMGGERLPSAGLGFDGIFGDRVVHVMDARGRRITARTRPALLGHKAVLGPDNEPVVDGRSWDSAEVKADVIAAAGPGCRLVRDDSPEGRYDILPLLLATDGAIAEVGVDSRRFRPNLLIGGVKGLEERDWEGKTLRIGEVLIASADLRGRCIMTTFDPDTLEQDTGVLRRIQRDFDGVLGLNCSVLRPGIVREGDTVEVVDGST